jgi:hypothetical protein
MADRRDRRDPGAGLRDPRAREHPEREALETAQRSRAAPDDAVSGRRPDPGQPSGFRTKTGQRHEGDRQVARGTVIALPTANRFA